MGHLRRTLIWLNPVTACVTHQSRQIVDLSKSASRLASKDMTYIHKSLLCLFAFLCFSGCEKPTSSEAPDPTKVGVLLLASHPVLHDLRNGFTERLKELSKQKNVAIEFDEKNAEGNAATLNQLVGYFSSGNHRLVYAIGSDSALKLKSKGSGTPVIFAGTPDPVRNGFVDSLENPGANLTGVRFLPPADRLLDTLNKRFPEVKKIGVLRNPAEINSQSVAEPLIAEAKKRGLMIIDYGVTEISQLPAVLARIKSEDPGAIFIPNDNLIYQNLKQVAAGLKEAGIPFFSVTDSSVKAGGAFAIGVSYHEMGRKAGDVAAELLLEGKAPGTVPVLNMREGHLFVPADQTETFHESATPEFPVTPVN
jgi:putative ABC transport system substrate-binding protein